MEDKMKKLLTERFQELAGIKPLDEQGMYIDDDEWETEMGRKLTDEEMDYLTNVTIEFHKKLNPDLNIEKSKAIMDFVISQLEEMY